VSAKKARHERQTQAARARASTGSASMMTRNASSGSTLWSALATAEPDAMLQQCRAAAGAARYVRRRGF
jgi:hypothetical protein